MQSRSDGGFAFCIRRSPWFAVRHSPFALLENGEWRTKANPPANPLRMPANPLRIPVPYLQEKPHCMSKFSEWGLFSFQRNL